LASDAEKPLERLAAFDRTSRRSSLDLIAFVARRLGNLVIGSSRIASPNGEKADL
jgi:hypothetical protein